MSEILNTYVSAGTYLFILLKLLKKLRLDIDAFIGKSATEENTTNNLGVTLLIRGSCRV